MTILKKKRSRFRLVIPAYSAFNIYSGIASRTTALGPVYVATSVSQMEGWDAEIVDENNLGSYGPKHPSGRGADHEKIQNQRPADVIGLYGGLTSTIPQLYEVAKFYKEKGLTTIAGGQHFAPENIEEALNSFIDFIILGEGEETVKELIQAIEQKTNVNQIKGIVFKQNNKVIYTESRLPIADLDALAVPNFSLVRYAIIKMYPIGRIRGCGMDCEFCCVRGKPRSSSPEHFLADISYLLETYDARHFFIVDDLFGQHRDETIRFCNMLAEYQFELGRRLDFTAQIRLDKAKDSELLTAMRKAGINTICIGFESPIEEDLASMSKRVKPQDMVDLARIYHKFGFLVHGMFIFGYPLKGGGASQISVNERIQKYRKFVKDAKIDTLQVLLAVPLPGTELSKRLKEQNRIYPLKDIGWEYYDGNFPIFEPDPPITAQDLQLAIRKIMGKFYQFRYMFMLAIHILFFPSLLFFLHNIRYGWKKWYRPWRNNLTRFGGWVILKGWTSAYKKGSFNEKLEDAQRDILKIPKS
jgi:radical SAM superfamily enzyme YgiQ (UPF0313 family)